MKRTEINLSYTRLEINVRLFRNLFYIFTKEYDRDELSRLLKRAGLPLEYFDNENNWISYEFQQRLFDELIEFTLDENIISRYNLMITEYPDELRMLIPIQAFSMTPAELFISSIDMESRYWKIGYNKILKIKKNSVVISSKLHKGYNPEINNCNHVKTVFATLPTFFDLPPAEIKDIQCAVDGADSCIFELSWKNIPVDFRKFLPFFVLVPAGVVLFFFAFLNIINVSTLWIILLILLPVTAFFWGHLFDYKIAIRNNIRISDDQNNTLMKAFERNQVLNEKLQITIEKRTEELKNVEKKLDSTLIQIEKSKKKLQLTERMAGVAHLAAGVAHEINNPMGAACNYIQEILEEMPETDLRYELVKQADNAVIESTGLINSMLSFSRVDNNLQIAEVDINEVINSIIMNILQTSDHRHLKIRKQLSQNVPEIQSDPMQINQAFTNLLLNSVKAINENTEIVVKSEITDDKIHIMIRDNGEVIPDYLIGTFFEPSEHELYGIGRKDLGTVMSYSIIRRFNGDIKVLSSKETGTVFDVFLPYE